MRHIADTGLHLDRVRDLSLELEAAVDGAEGRAHEEGGAVNAAVVALREQVEACNRSITGIVTEIEAHLARDAAEKGRKQGHT